MRRTIVYSLACVTAASLSTMAARTAASAGQGAALIRLQNSTPGSSQVGHSNITGRAIMGEFQLTSASTSGFVLTTNAAGVGTWQSLPTTLLQLPYSGSASVNLGTAFFATNTADGYGIRGVSGGASGQNISGYARSGVWGDSVSGNGVIGTTGGANGYGVFGLGTSFGSVGVRGVNTAGQGVHGTSNTGWGVRGDSASNNGVTGLSTSGVGTYGSSNSNYGLQGSSSSSTGIRGDSTTGMGIQGNSNNNIGVYGSSANSTGVQGTTFTGVGVYGSSNSNNGVQGSSSSNNGVRGDSSTGQGVLGVSNGGYGMLGINVGNSSGIVGTYGAAWTYGLHTGVSGSTTVGGFGLFGWATDGTGVFGHSDTGWAAEFNGKLGVNTTNGSRRLVGIGDSSLPGTTSGIDGPGLVYTYGTDATVLCSLTYLLSGNQPTNQAGIFVGHGTTAGAGMYMNSDLTTGTIVASIKNFREPNPDQPGTDIVYACVEGPEAAAYVRGTGHLVNGSATIWLPKHFVNVSVLNGMTVQLTPNSPDSRGLAIVRKSLTEGIIVQELGKGRGTYDFDYLVTCVRKGYEDYEVIRPKLEIERGDVIDSKPPQSKSWGFRNGSKDILPRKQS